MDRLTGGPGVGEGRRAARDRRGGVGLRRRAVGLAAVAPGGTAGIDRLIGGTRRWPGGGDRRKSARRSGPALPRGRPGRGGARWDSRDGRTDRGAGARRGRRDGRRGRGALRSGREKGKRLRMFSALPLVVLLGVLVAAGGVILFSGLRMTGMADRHRRPHRHGRGADRRRAAGRGDVAVGHRWCRSPRRWRASRRWPSPTASAASPRRPRSWPSPTCSTAGPTWSMPPPSSPTCSRARC